MKYERKAIAFIDILGFKEEIDKIGSKHNVEQLNRVNFVIDSLLQLDNQTKSEFHKIHANPSLAATAFSDCIVISAPEKDYLQVVLMAMRTAEVVLHKGFLCRGGVVIGDALHEDKKIFGKAMVEAYFAESRDAMFPRIILSEEIANKITTNGTEWVRNTIKQDERDGRHYVNTFYGPHLHLLNSIIKKNNPENEVKYWEMLRQCIENGLGHLDAKVQAKYIWSAKRYNKFMLSSATAITHRLLEEDEYKLYSKQKKMCAKCGLIEP